MATRWLLRLAWWLAAVPVVLQLQQNVLAPYVEAFHETVAMVGRVSR